MGSARKIALRFFDGGLASSSVGHFDTAAQGRVVVYRPIVLARAYELEDCKSQTYCPRRAAQRLRGFLRGASISFRGGGRTNKKLLVALLAGAAIML